MMRKLKNEKGVTLVSLGIAVFVILILTSVILYNIKDSLKLNKLQQMYNDIDNLRDKISEYYLEYGDIPAKIKYTNVSHIDSISAASDTGDFYVIDLSALENLTLNYGEDFERVKDMPADTVLSDNTYTDLYIINIDSHNVFYVAGIESDERTFYTDDVADIAEVELINVAEEVSINAGETVPSGKIGSYSDGTDTAKVPAGFTVSNIDGEKTIANGLVIYDTQGATNVDWTTAQTTYNQFVWIPVASAESYVRNLSYPSYYYINNSWTNSDATPADSTFTDTSYLPEEIQPETDSAEANETAERNAVVNAKGFYISRYEAGDGSTTSNRSDSSGTTGELVSKKNAFVYNYINQINSKAKAKTMYSGKTALCSGIQWDMVMKFVDGKKDAEGTDNFDVRTVNSRRHTWGLAKTGANNHDKVQNIYDLEGNTFEYVAEKNATSGPFVRRGGNYNNYSEYRASSRFSNFDAANYLYNSFRVTLYVR